MALDTDGLATTVVTRGAARRAPKRRDIQGLRAVAVTLVVLYHAHVPGIPGGYVGVDVFFVISGFLITSQILREIDRTGHLSLAAFYGRRMRRLLPAALLVAVTTLVVARFWGPALQLTSTARDGLWTAGYAVNLHLAAERVNYLQSAGPASPFQHYWSLAVEEQFYLVWPPVILATVLLARRFARAALVSIVVAAVAGSLFLSISVTQEAQPLAYFCLQTRAWEFGVGAVVAVGVARLSVLPAAARAPASWIGLALIVGSAIVYDDNTPFPGSAALLPVIGCALVIAAGCGSHIPRGSGLVLERRPLQGIGKVSYSWYLWHWPMLLLVPAILGTTFSWVHNAELTVLALWLAALTYAIVERPTQRGEFRPRAWLARGLGLSALAAGAAVLVLVTAPAIAGNGAPAPALDLRLSGLEGLRSALTAASSSGSVPGNLTPALAQAADDVAVTEGGCHLDFLQFDQGACVYGDPAGSRTLVLFGDSHAQQWMGGLDHEAKLLHWKLVSWTKAACPVADVTLVNPTLKRTYTECDVWREATIQRINALQPALILVSQSDSVPGRLVSNGRWAVQTLKTLRRLQNPETRIVFVADTPYPSTDVPSCVSTHLADARACMVARNQAYHASTMYTARHLLVSSTLDEAGVHVVDPVDWLCSATACPVIVANTLVYRDDSHISNTYSTALAPILGSLFPADPPKPASS